MAKQGIIHDYDLHANLEKSGKQQTCVVCDTSPMTFQWSDYSGEAMCTKCGCPYQLKWGSDKQKREGKYPYLNVKKEYIWLLKEYWDKTHKFVCHGTMMINEPIGLKEFNEWLEQTHPELIKDEEAD